MITRILLNLYSRDTQLHIRLVGITLQIFVVILLRISLKILSLYSILFFLYIIMLQECVNFAGKIIEIIGIRQKQRVNTGIIGANLNTVCPISYNSCEIQQDRMVKGRVAPPKCLFYINTQIEKHQYTLIEQSAHSVLLKLAFTNTIQLYSYLAHNQSSYRLYKTEKLQEILNRIMLRIMRIIISTLHQCLSSVSLTFTAP